MNTRKKGDILEAIVATIEVALSDDPNLFIRTNFKKFDVDGIEREIDIYVETTFSGRLFKIAIECKYYESAISLEKVDAYLKKCEKLKIDRPIFVATNRFQAGVLKRVEKENIDILELKDIPARDENNKPDNDSEDFGLKEVKVLKFDYDFKGINIWSTEYQIFKKSPKTYFPLEELKIVDKQDNRITSKKFKRSLVEHNRQLLFRYLYTQNGILINYRKKLSLRSNGEELFIKERRKKFAVNKITFSIEVWSEIFQIDLSGVKHYREVISNKLLASLISHEFTISDSKYSLNIVKTITNKMEFSVLEKGNFESLKLFGEPVEIKRDVLEVRNIEFDNKASEVESVEYNLTDNALDSVENQTSNEKPEKLIKELKDNHENSALVAINPTTKKLFFILPIKYRNKMYGAKFPDPVLLMFSHALDLLNQSDSFKAKLPEVTQEIGSTGDFFLVADETYHKYFQTRISAALALRMALESFVNVYLPKSGDKNYINDFSLVEKIHKVTEEFPVLSENEELSKEIFGFCDISFALTSLTGTMEIRAKDKGMNSIDIFENLSNFDFNQAISSMKKWMNIIRKDYIKTKAPT